MHDVLWEQVKGCFDTDDGSLPGIEVAGLSPAGVAEIYAMLRRRARAGGESPSFWDRTEQAERSVDSVSNAAALTAGGEADAFHFVITGVVSGGVELPPLGVFVWPDTIELDYRMGPGWGPGRVAGFFELLGDCCDLDPGAVVGFEPFDGPPHPERFLRAWTTWRRGDGVDP